MTFGGTTTLLQRNKGSQAQIAATRDHMGNPFVNKNVNGRGLRDSSYGGDTVDDPLVSKITTGRRVPKRLLRHERKVRWIGLIDGGLANLIIGALLLVQTMDFISMTEVIRNYKLWIICYTTLFSLAVLIKTLVFVFCYLGNVFYWIPSLDSFRFYHNTTNHARRLPQFFEVWFAYISLMLVQWMFVEHHGYVNPHHITNIFEQLPYLTIGILSTTFFVQWCSSWIQYVGAVTEPWVDTFHKHAFP